MRSMKFFNVKLECKIYAKTQQVAINKIYRYLETTGDTLFVNINKIKEVNPNSFSTIKGKSN